MFYEKIEARDVGQLNKKIEKLSAEPIQFSERGRTVSAWVKYDKAAYEAKEEAEVKAQADAREANAKAEAKKAKAEAKAKKGE
jgi:hypothetical protein